MFVLFNCTSSRKTCGKKYAGHKMCVKIKRFLHFVIIQCSKNKLTARNVDVSAHRSEGCPAGDKCLLNCKELSSCCPPFDLRMETDSVIESFVVGGTVSSKITPCSNALLVSSSVTTGLHLLRNQYVRYRVHNSPPLVPILSQIKPVKALLRYYSRLHFNIILSVSA